MRIELLFFLLNHYLFGFFWLVNSLILLIMLFLGGKKSMKGKYEGKMRIYI